MIKNERNFPRIGHLCVVNKTQIDEGNHILTVSYKYAVA